MRRFIGCSAGDKGTCVIRVGNVRFRNRWDDPLFRKHIACALDSQRVIGAPREI